MVTNRKNDTHAERLLALYRSEQDHWTSHELLEGLIDLPNMKSGTVARILARLNRPRCSRTVVSKMAESAIREMVDHGHAADVEAFLGRQAEARAEFTRAQQIAAILETARRVDAVFPRTPVDRERGDLSSTELLLTRTVDAADEHELAAMLEAVLRVASDRVVSDVDDTRQSEERMLAEYLAEQERGAA